MSYHDVIRLYYRKKIAICFCINFNIIINIYLD